MSDRDRAETQVAVMREVLIARVLDVLAERTAEQLRVAGHAWPASRTIEHVNNTLEWAAVTFVNALNDPALEVDDGA